MDTASVAIVVTSPPYNTLPVKNSPSGIHAERKTGVNLWIQKAVNGYPDARPEPEYQAWLRFIVEECRRVACGLVWVNHKVRYRDGVAIHPVQFLPYPIYSEVIWDRRGSMALNCKRFSPSHETLLAFGTPHTWNDCLNSKMSVWQIPFDRGGDSHPCAFPVDLAQRPIVASSNEGDVVLDPFMGTGTTLFAAKGTNRKAIGIEIEERYCEIAAKRLAQGVFDFAAPSAGG
jgi:hypothetical protein